VQAGEGTSVDFVSATAFLRRWNGSQWVICQTFTDLIIDTSPDSQAAAVGYGACQTPGAFKTQGLHQGRVGSSPVVSAYTETPEAYNA